MRSRCNGSSIENKLMTKRFEFLLLYEYSVPLVGGESLGSVLR